MLHRTFGKTGFDISAVGMVTWNIGNQWGDTDDGNAFTTIRTAFDHGVTLFDTAENYGIPGGTSEERLGLALAGFFLGQRALLPAIIVFLTLMGFFQ